MWSPKNDANEFVYKTEIDFQCRKRTWGDKDKLGVWDQQIHTITYKTDKQRGPTIQHRELYPVSCNNLQCKKYEKNI